MAQLTATERLPDPPASSVEMPSGTALYRISGPLFFGAAEKAIATLRTVDPEVKTVLLDMHAVPSLDATATVALDGLRHELAEQHIGVIFIGLPARLRLKLKRAGIYREVGKLAMASSLERAAQIARRWQESG
jgi:SulP family sulfate permease